MLAKIQTLMLQADVLALQDPNYIPDSGSGVYIIFLIIGIIGYFTIPTVAEWVIQSAEPRGYGRYQQGPGHSPRVSRAVSPAT